MWFDKHQYMALSNHNSGTFRIFPFSYRYDFKIGRSENRVHAYCNRKHLLYFYSKLLWFQILYIYFTKYCLIITLCIVPLHILILDMHKSNLSPLSSYFFLSFSVFYAGSVSISSPFSTILCFSLSVHIFPYTFVLTSSWASEKNFLAYSLFVSVLL